MKYSAVPMYSDSSVSANALLPLLLQQLQLQEKNLELQKKLIEAIDPLGVHTLPHISASANQKSQRALTTNPQRKSKIISQKDFEGSREATDSESDSDPESNQTPTPSAFRMYFRFLLSGDAFQCFTEHPAWEDITTDSMSAPRIREKISATLESLMVFYTLVLTIAVGALHHVAEVPKLGSPISDVIFTCLSYVIACFSFSATTLVFCVLKMVLAVSDCNLKLWCKANSRVFILHSIMHNMLTLSTAGFLVFLFFRTFRIAIPEESFPMSVDIGITIGVFVFSLAMFVFTGASLCAPARSAGHTGATSELPLCSDAASTQASPDDAKRILYNEAFEPDLSKVVQFFRSGGGQEGDVPASDDVRFIRQDGFFGRPSKQNVS